MSKIKFVRTYKLSGKYDYVDIVYHSGYIRTCTPEELPTTAERWIITHDKTTHYDPVFKRDETIYM